jgi:hypothetical protein
MSTLPSSAVSQRTAQPTSGPGSAGNWSKPIGDHLQNQESGVGAVEAAEAVATWLDIQVGTGAAVYDHSIAKGLQVPKRWHVASGKQGPSNSSQNFRLAG